MASMVGGVEILSIPAGWEDDGGADTAGARLGRESGSVRPVAGGSVAAHDAFRLGETTVADGHASGLLGTVHRVARDHPEALNSISLCPASEYDVFVFCSRSS